MYILMGIMTYSSFYIVPTRIIEAWVNLIKAKFVWSWVYRVEIPTSINALKPPRTKDHLQRNQIRTQRIILV